MRGRQKEAIARLSKARDPEPSHSEQDARLALRLFDELVFLHGLGERDRDVLEAAALLHDVGWSASPDGSRHHKHAFRMIMDAGLEGFTKEETLMIANVARYHRRALPRGSHRGFSALSPEARTRTARMAALLRVADGLDRAHRNAVRDLSCRVEGHRLILRIACACPPDAEIATALKKADLLREVFGLELLIDVAEGGRDHPPD